MNTNLTKQDILNFINANPVLQFIYELAESPEVTAHELLMYIKGSAVNANDIELLILCNAVTLSAQDSVKKSISRSVFNYLRNPK